MLTRIWTAFTWLMVLLWRLVTLPVLFVVAFVRAWRLERLREEVEISREVTRILQARWDLYEEQRKKRRAERKARRVRQGSKRRWH